MSNSTIKRIAKDIKIYNNSNLEDVGIYCKFDEHNIYNARCLIIGPKDTPYQYGYYFFKLKFPSDYPLTPPKVTLITQGNSIRFNPNLYTNGKVCLSILGTWEGPSWSACLNLNAILLSIQSLLNENPIQNEPGWENVDDSRSLDYSNIIRYSNIRIAILNMIDNTPYEFENFKSIMMGELKKNQEPILTYIRANLDNNNILRSNIYSLSIKTDYEYILKTLQTILDIKEDIKEKIISKRKVPNGNANTFDIGCEKVSENDGSTYIIGNTKTNKKRWIKKDG